VRRDAIGRVEVQSVFSALIAKSELLPRGHYLSAREDAVTRSSLTRASSKPSHETGIRSAKNALPAPELSHLLMVNSTFTVAEFASGASMLETSWKRAFGCCWDVRRLLVDILLVRSIRYCTLTLLESEPLGLILKADIRLRVSHYRKSIAKL
jgi:hypothetical protein